MKVGRRAPTAVLQRLDLVQSLRGDAMPNINQITFQNRSNTYKSSKGNCFYIRTSFIYVAVVLM